ncbi:hypothetical protein BKA61DRAFT_582731 [Leptodontidium sp. MPI-SDFR-AT-0119]|nr:hypothetical protein BKA61DRAFT_582731 [Leptodontidium sp. MPI-SDFR-AT-0119]
MSQPAETNSKHCLEFKIPFGPCTDIWTVPDVLASLPSERDSTAIEQERLKAGAYKVQRTSIEAVRQLTIAIGTARSKRRNILGRNPGRPKISRSRAAALQLGRPAKATILVSISPSRYISFCVRRIQLRNSRIPDQMPIR